jgi:hypothetical protein
MTMIVPLLSALATLASTPAAPDRVMMCYVQSADLNTIDPADPHHITVSGPKRLLVLKFPGGADRTFVGARAKLHDPTHVFLDRSITAVIHQPEKDIYAFLTGGDDNDSLMMIVNPSVPGETTHTTLVARTIKDKPLTYTLAGSCSYATTADPAADFARMSKEPDTQP